LGSSVHDGGNITYRLLNAGRISDAGEGIDGSAVETATVVVYVGDEAGGQLAHYFTRVS
jgi:hypothetical protein